MPETGFIAEKESAMRKLTILIAGVVTALALLAIGCDGSDEPEASVPEQDPTSVPAGAGLVPLNRFLEFDGQRYMLTLELREGMFNASEFHALGEASSSDITLPGGNTVYSRDGDPDAVFTHSPATADDGEMWLRWAKA
jgi:hypothetical protein